MDPADKFWTIIIQMLAKISSKMEVKKPHNNNLCNNIRAIVVLQLRQV